MTHNFAQFEGVQRQYDWATVSPSVAILETMAVFEHGEPRKAADVLETPLSEHIGPDALDDLVGNDALIAISLTISDYHVLISENTVGIELDESASHAT